MKIVSVFGVVSLVAADECGADPVSMIQVSRLREHASIASGNRHQQLFEDRAIDSMCLPVVAGDRAPINGVYTQHGSNQRHQVTVGDVAPASGRFCVDKQSFALLQRSLGNAGLDGAHVERALMKKGNEQKDENVEQTTSGKDKGLQNKVPVPGPKQYKGYEVVGDGACATSDQSSRSSGEYTCLDGAHEGCAGGEEPTEDDDGFLLCAGPDGQINTDDDTYLECAETDHTQDQCIEACTAKSGCNGVEYKVASHTKKSVCELHYTTIDGWKDSVWFNRNDDGSFPSKPDGQGFRKGIFDENNKAEISLPVDDLQGCKDECKKHADCKGIEYEQPQVLDHKGDCEVQFETFSHYVKGSCYKKIEEVKQYEGYTVIGDGACATSDNSSRSSGEYTCLDGAHEGCAGGEEPTEDNDGFLLCAGPDGQINTDDDTYLECAETDHTQDQCIEACTAKSGCNGVEYKVASHTKKSVCELHYTTIDGWKDSVWFNRNDDGSFPSKPDGQGFRKGVFDENNTAEISLPVDDLQGCKDECAKYADCKGIEYEQPQVLDHKGDCEVQFETFSHYVKGSCYKKN